MALPDLNALADAGGWLVAVGSLLSILGLILTGHLVPGRTHDREVKRGDSLDETLRTTTDTLRELTAHVDTVIDTALSEPPSRRGRRST